MLRMSKVMLRTLSNKNDDVPDVMSATKRCGVLILRHASVPRKKGKVVLFTSLACHNEDRRLEWEEAYFQGLLLTSGSSTFSLL